MKKYIRSNRISASIELVDTIGYIKNDNGKFDVCVVETPYADMQLATYDPVEDEYDILETVKDLDDARKKATTQFKSQPEFVMASGNPFYDKLSDKDKRFVRNTKKQMANNVTTIYGDYDTTLTIDMWYGDKFVPRKYGADASVYGNGEYRGNIYDNSGKIIGDYTSDNSVLIEDNFLIDFGA